MANNWESLEEDPRQEVWETWPGAVLLDDEIEYYSSRPEYPLISPFNKENLKPARYQLSLGPEARVGGKTVNIDKQRPLTIPPHQVAIVRSYETINLPRFLIARWNLKVDMVYRGLLWVGALQVDPGWIGYLPCPLYNLSDETVTINYRETLFTMDFVRTTKFAVGKNRSYPDKSPPPPINPSINFYDEHRLRSAPYEALRQLRELRYFRNFGYTAVSLIMLVLTFMVAALAVIAGAQNVDVKIPPNIAVFWCIMGVLAFIALVSVILNLVVFFRLRKLL